MRHFLILATLIFSDLVFSQGNSNDTILICENNDKWFGVQLNSDLEEVSYIEFGDFFYKGKRVYDIKEPTSNWKRAKDIGFTLETISFSRQSDPFAWTMMINRESLKARLQVFTTYFYYYDRHPLTCSIIENKDVLKTRIDLEIQKKQLEKQKKLQQEKDEAERKRLEREAKKKKNKI